MWKLQFSNLFSCLNGSRKNCPPLSSSNFFIHIFWKNPRNLRTFYRSVFRRRVLRPFAFLFVLSSIYSIGIGISS